jgi:putative membrane protein
MMWWNDGWGWWWMMPLLMAAFWVAGAWLVVGLLRDRPARPDGGSDRPESPEQVLAHRYARGELDDEEYRRRLDTLRNTRQAGARR